MAQTVTLTDIAARAGVSTATASRALSGKPRVSREMIERVRAVAEELGYRVDPTARALRAGSSRLVGMIVPVIGIPFFSQLIDAVEENLNKAGFELLLADSHGFIDEEVRRLRVFADRRVDGILLIPSDRAGSVTSMRSLPAGLPVVQVDRATDLPIADYVGVDNEVGFRLIFEYLTNLGVKTVAFAASDDATLNGVERWDSFHKLAAEHELAITGTYRSEFSIASGVAAAEELLKFALPDAIVAGSDQIAVGVVSRLRQAGLSVPEDLLVTGFDGSELAAVLWPSLTTIVQPIDAIASDAVNLLVRRINGDEGAVRRNRVTPSLLVGRSTDISLTRPRGRQADVSIHGATQS